jgi:hypothetical protein
MKGVVIMSVLVVVTMHGSVLVHDEARRGDDITDM